MVSDLVAQHRKKVAATGATMTFFLLGIAAGGDVSVFEVDISGVEGRPRIVAGVVALLAGASSVAVAAGLWPKRKPQPPLVGNDLDEFVDRPELAQLEEKLSEPRARVVCLTGPAGAGKSRLAREVGRRIKQRRELQFVDLRGVHEGDELLRKALRGLATAKGDEAGDSSVLVDWFAKRSALLVLDNADDALAATATLVDRLVADCDRLTVLVTSQLALSIGGTAIEVRGLAVPPEGATKLDEILRYPAVQLLAGAAGQKAVEDEPAAAASLCRRLEGSPGLLKAIAPELDVYSVQELDKRLSDVTRNVPSFDDVLGLAHNRLERPERALFRRLAVLRGPFPLAMVGSICNPALTPEAVEKSFTELVRRRLVLRVLDNPDAVGPRIPPDPKHFRLPAPYRSYAHRQLIEEEGETALPQLQDRHAATYRTAVESLADDLTTKDRPTALARLAAWSDDLDDALEWADRNAPDVLTGLVARLFWFWNFRGELREAARWLDRALPKAGTADEATRARLHYGRGGIAFLQGQQELAKRELQEAVDLWAARRDDTVRLGLALLLLGTVELERGEIDGAEAHGAEAVTLLEGQSNEWPLALALNDRGNARAAVGDDAARALYERSAGLWERLGDRWGMSLTQNNLGSLVWRSGKGTDEVYRDAEQQLRRALEIQVADGDLWGEAWSHRALGELALCRGSLDAALASFSTSLEQHQRIGRVQLVADCVSGIGRTAGQSGDPERCAVLLGGAGEVRRLSGVRLWPVEDRLHQKSVDGLRDALGDSRLRAMMEEGAALVRRAADGTMDLTGLVQVAQQTGPKAVP